MQKEEPPPESASSMDDAPTRSLSGSLKTMHLADLLQWCAIHVKTGTLQLRQGSTEKRLYFRDGQLFSSSSNSPREVLGQFLIRSGHIGEETVKQDFPDIDLHLLEMQAFLDAVRSHEPEMVRSDFADATRTLAVVLAGDRSIKAGTWEAVEEV